jgi:transforming growth factor-beta-induced protein
LLQKLPRLRSVLDVVRETDIFKAFFASLNICGLAEMLQAKSPLTIFAPTDSAFSKLPRSILDAYLFDRDLLAELVSNHILEGEMNAMSVNSWDSRMCVGGKRFRTKRGAVYVEEARLVLPDIFCENGILHGINRVLLPSLRHHIKYRRRGRI